MKFLAILLALAVTAGAEQHQSFKQRHVPLAVSSMTPLGDLEPTNQIHLSIVLPLRNQDALEELLKDQQDPASSQYRHWLTNGEFAARFGPTTNDYAAVESWAKSKNLSVVMQHEGRTSLSVKGSSADVGRAFNVGFKKYQHPTENRMFHAPTKEPTMDLETPVLAIIGLDNLAVTVKNSHTQTGAIPTTGSGPGGTYGGYNFRNAYQPNVALTGSGQTVGIVAFASFYTTDLPAYSSYYGLPAFTYSYVNIDGGPSTTDIEAALDIEMVHAMSPSATIRVYQGPDYTVSTGANWLDLVTYIANENSCRQITCSYAVNTIYLDANYIATYYIFEQMESQGQSFFTSSGDWNAYTTATGYDVLYPALFTNITVVGGTTLTTSGTSWSSETAWNSGAYGSGGGIGACDYALPTYQQGISMAANLGSTSCRNYPDVALTASGIDVIYNGVHNNEMGTSASTPLWAGLCALINQQAAANGKPSVGWLNPAIYTLGKSAAYTDCFHDITTGNNFWSSSPSHFPAVTGYDLCTGWGTPNGTNLINALYTGPAFTSLVFSNGLFIKATSP
jgi:subtilase family serine protease